MRHGRRGADRDRDRGASARARTRGRAWGAVPSAVARHVRGSPIRVREDRGLRLHGGLAADGAHELRGARRAAVPLTRTGLVRRRRTPDAGARGPVRRDLAAAVDDGPDRRGVRCAQRDPGHAAARLDRGRVRGVVGHPRRMGPDARRLVRRARARCVRPAVVRDARRHAGHGRRVRRSRRRRPPARRRAKRQPVRPRRASRARRLELGLPRRVDARRLVVAAEPAPRGRARTVGVDARSRAVRRPSWRGSSWSMPGGSRSPRRRTCGSCSWIKGWSRCGGPATSWASGHPTPPDIAPATRCYNRPRWPSPPPTTQTCSTCFAAGGCA